MLGIVEEPSKMSQRKPLQTVSSNSALVTCTCAVRKSYATQRKGTARVAKRAKRISGADEIVNPPAPTSPPENQYSLNPEIPDTFTLLPHSFSPHEAEPSLLNNPSTPYDVFSEFWDEEVFTILANNMNEYAAKMRGLTPPLGLSSLRSRKPETVGEMRQFVAQVIFIEVHGCRSLVEFWRQPNLIGIHERLSLKHFPQIKRYLHVEPVQIEGRSDME